MKNSLSKKNGVGTTAGVGANPTSSYRKFKKMQLLDRQISRLKNTLNLRKLLNPKQYQKDLEKIEKLDLKRKETRLTKSINNLLDFKSLFCKTPEELIETGKEIRKTVMPS